MGLDRSTWQVSLVQVGFDQTADLAKRHRKDRELLLGALGLLGGGVDPVDLVAVALVPGLDLLVDEAPDLVWIAAVVRAAIAPYRS
ncbi:hypothetical protein GCM10029992_58270 [Glycomyces albus]